MGFFLHPFHRSIRKQQRQNPKFYFFDNGVVNALAHTLQQRIVPNTYGYGKAFEQFIVTEIHRLNIYCQKDYKLYYLRTKDDAEIDLIIEKPDHALILIEIKSAKTIDERDVRQLNHFLASFPKATAMALSQDPVSKKIDKVICHHWRKGLTELGLDPEM